MAKPIKGNLSPKMILDALIRLSKDKQPSTPEYEIVLAANYRQFHQYLIEEEKHPKHCIYVSSMRNLNGKRNWKITLLPGYYENTNAHDIIEYLETWDTWKTRKIL